MSQKRRRTFTEEQKSEAVKIVEDSGKPIRQIAREMGLTESALRKWVKQAKIENQGGGQGELTSRERQELNNLRRELKRVEMERDFLKKVATFFAKENSEPMS
jgi:transposase